MIPEPRLDSYPWTSNSPTVRLDRALLDRLMIRSVTITNSATMNFFVTPLFTAIFHLQSEEVARINATLTKTLHEYRIVHGKHFQPLDDETVFAKAEMEQPYPTGSFRFKVRPFPEAALAIREKLEAEVLQTLGSDRASFFWRFAWLLPGEFNVTNHATFERTTYSFQLLKESPGPLVDIKSYTAGGYGGRPYGAPLDLYAPEKLKPILVRWREWIAQQPPATFDWTVQSDDNEAPKPAGLPQEQKWDEAAPYLDLPKSFIPFLKIAGLTHDESISAEAIAVFALTGDELKAVTELHAEMKRRVEQLEVAHLERPDPLKTRFVLRAFPQRMAEVKKEWISKLKEAVGADRADLLDESIRIPEHPFARRMRGERAFVPRPTDGPRWFDRGAFDIRIEFRTLLAPDGTERQEFRYESDQPESGSIGAPKVTIPKRFEHLLTPEMFKPVPLNL